MNMKREDNNQVKSTIQYLFIGLDIYFYPDFGSLHLSQKNRKFALLILPLRKQKTF